MHKFRTKIYGLDCYRISKTKARNLCKSTEVSVYMCMVNLNPSHCFSSTFCLNIEPLQPHEFEKNVANYLYYNRSPQAGYYVSFYSEDPDTKPRKSP